MKKTLVALAITAFAASASAITVYEKDGSKVSVGGRVHYALKNQFDDTKRADIENESSRLSVRAEHDLAEGYKALGYVEIGVGDTVTTRRSWLGFSADKIGTLTFGRQKTNGNDIGLSDFTNLYGGVNQVLGRGNKVVKFTSESFGGFSFGADYLLGESDRDVSVKQPSTKTINSDKYRKAYDVAVFYSNKLNNDFTFKANAGFSESKFDIADHKSEARRAWTVAAGTEYGKFSFGIDYSEVKDTSKADNVKLIFDKGRNNPNQKASLVRLLEIGANYQVLDSLDVYGALIFGRGQTADKKIKGAYREAIAGTTYKINKYVRTYVEGSISKLTVNNNVKISEPTNKQIGVGLRLDF